MKKYISMVATVALMAAVSCNKEEANGPGSQESSKITVEFTAASSTDTKAVLVEGDKDTPHSIKWEANDAIAVNGEVFTTEDNGYKATFKGEVEQSFTVAQSYQAVYPAKSGEIVQTFEAIVVPTEQKGVADSFEDIVSVAYSTTTSLQFKHVTSLLRLQVPEFAEKITSITLTSETDLAGTVSVTMEDSESVPEVTVTTGQKTITLTCEDGFVEETDYYIAVLPGEKTNLEVRINGYLSKTYTTADIPVGGVANMGLLPEPVESEWFIVGGFAAWNTEECVKMYEDNNYHVAKNVSGLNNVVENADKGFKITNGTIWNGAESGVVMLNHEYATGGNNITLTSDDITCDIYFDPTNNKLYFMEPGNTPADATKPTEGTDVKIVGGNEVLGYWCPSYAKSMVNSGDLYVATGVTLNTEFKIIIDDAWYSCSDMTIGEWKQLVGVNNNITVSDGIYDIYVYKEDCMIYIAESGADVPGVPQEEKIKLYVKDNTDPSLYTTLYMHAYEGETNLTGDWPGVSSSVTETINGNEYKVFTLSSDYLGKTVNFIFNNNAGSQNKSVAFELNDIQYLDVTENQTKVVDANNVSLDKPLTFYLYDQKNKWKDNKVYCTISSIKNDITDNVCKIKDKEYYFMEVASNTTATFTSDSGNTYKSDLVFTLNTDDMYIGIWWDSDSSNGSWSSTNPLQ